MPCIAWKIHHNADKIHKKDNTLGNVDKIYNKIKYFGQCSDDDCDDTMAFNNDDGTKEKSCGSQNFLNKIQWL